MLALVGLGRLLGTLDDREEALRAMAFQTEAHHTEVSAQGRTICNAALGVVLMSLLQAVVSDGVFVRSVTARIRTELNLA